MSQRCGRARARLSGLTQHDTHDSPFLVSYQSFTRSTELANRLHLLWTTQESAATYLPLSGADPIDRNCGCALRSTAPTGVQSNEELCQRANWTLARNGDSELPPAWLAYKMVSYGPERPSIMTIQKILFPVDFSERSRAVAPFVLSMALRHTASVVLMNVIQPPAPLYSGGVSGGMDAVYPTEPFDYTEIRPIITKNLNEFAAAELPTVEVASVVDIGDPASAIVGYAHDAANGIDLIAMPTHGYGLFRRALLGSVTAKVLHDAKMPIWMSAHAPEPSHRAHPQPRHVVVAIDPDQRARETLDAAMAMAKETEATVDIVTAVSEGMIAPGMADADLEGLLIEGTRELLAKLQFEAGTDAGFVIEVGGPAKVVRDAALAKRADLVVVGRSDVHGILGRFRENSYSIIREAPCPVLSL